MMKGSISENAILKTIPVVSITPFTIQDFPNFTACIIWFFGCNFRCKYCHNPELVIGSMCRLPFEFIDAFLQKRQKLLDGVVLSGGECTLYNNLPEFIYYIRNMGYRIKLDTNGSNPVMLKLLLDNNLLDYVAIDYKSPLIQNRYNYITKYKSISNIAKSLDILCNSTIDFEVRTTIHTDLIDEEDINHIIQDLQERNFRFNYYIQNFKQNNTLEPISLPTRYIDMRKINIPRTFKILFR